MARIRSVHPEQPLDEDFVQCSAWGRLLAIFLRNHADDNGVFEWKPVQLKMKIFPCDNVDVTALLEELAEHRQVKSFEHAGRKYGAIRNFAQYQRPKKPKAVHFIPAEFRTYVGLDKRSTEPVPHQGATEGENSPQMEDVGSSSVANATDAVASGGTFSDLKAEVWKRARALLAKHDVPDKHAGSLIGKWLKALGPPDSETQLLHILAGAEVNCHGDLIEYVTAAIQRRGQNGKRTEHRNGWAEAIAEGSV